MRPAIPNHRLSINPLLKPAVPSETDVQLFLNCQIYTQLPAIWLHPPLPVFQTFGGARIAHLIAEIPQVYSVREIFLVKGWRTLDLTFHLADGYVNAFRQGVSLPLVACADATTQLRCGLLRADKTSS